MAKKKTVKAERPHFKDLVTLASAGWTPGQVNELLDRFDSLGDLNAPEEPEEDDEGIDVKNTDPEESDEDEDNNVPAEDEEEQEDEEENEDEDTSDDSKDKKKNTNKSNSLEVENARLKKQIQKLQQKNRRKDVSGGHDEKPIEKSLIDTFQSIFD